MLELPPRSPSWTQLWGDLLLANISPHNWCPGHLTPMLLPVLKLWTMDHPNLFQYCNDYANYEILKRTIYMNVRMPFRVHPATEQRGFFKAFSVRCRLWFWSHHEVNWNCIRSFLSETRRTKPEADLFGHFRSWCSLFCHFSRVPVMSHQSTELYHCCKHFSLSLLWACWWRSADHRLMLTAC